MKADDTNIAQFYGLRKVHKEGTPLRPIVSLPGTPSYKLAKELWRRLKHLISGSEHTINNASQFLHRLRNANIEDDEIMLSFDVTSLFTSINHNLARETIAELLGNNPNTTGAMKPESMCKLLDFCMDTYFSFDGQIYQQLKGTPMGSPISGFIAEAVMQRLERAVLPIINPKLWIRYVDDTFVIMKRDALHRTHELLNTTFEDIKFTVELERNNRLPFLDVLVNRKMDGTLETCVYRKQTHTDQILNYNSNHPMNHKKSCVQTLFKRAETHCSTTELRKKEENYLFRVFQKNGYPRNFIKRSLKKKTTQQQQQREQATRRVVLPYIHNISELTTRLLAQKGIVVAHKPNATLRKLISRPKGSQDKTKRNNVVYQINCNNCNKFYVGQTGRKLCTRMKEHNAAVRRHDPLSLISIHEDQEGHKFSVENVKILAYGDTKHGGEFLEAWYSTADSINRCIELDPIYAPLRAKDQLLHRNTRGEPNIGFKNQKARNCWESDQQRSQAGTQRGQRQRSPQHRSEHEGTGGQAHNSRGHRSIRTRDNRTTNRDRRSTPANSMHINTHATLLNAQPPTHRYAPPRSLPMH
ncbi:hypothetical protein CLF_108233 [Clonorchis sinensis]|uniref:Reverse transcriptase domain-containing protein n=1 Tax=Clonorchis sinensis TaxID=79923 RepID=G7YRE7_CLOSI|nr:hypothetical protein CLF_108233 [Clonorchis sinensis]